MVGDRRVEEEYRRLLRERDRLIEEIRSLKRRYEKGEVDKESYRRSRYDLERRIVEVMDRIAQLKFLLGVG